MVPFFVHAFVISILVWGAEADTPKLLAPLTIGSPIPKLAAMKYVKGEAVKELSAGTIYLVEFSGTDCAPCHKCIPLLNELQTKHSDVVLISIYSEKEKPVREFLAGKGKDIAFRVAIDPSGRMWRDWHEPACQDGIPCAFVVGKQGRIAWIGHPENLAEPFAQIVAGTFDSQEHALRLKVEQEAVLRLRHAREREKMGADEYNRINEMTIAGKLADALADTEKALAAYHDCPDATELHSLARVYLLANLPGKQEEAFKMATELAVEAKINGRFTVMNNTAKGLLNAAERAEGKARDKRLIDLALPLLCDPSPFDPNLRGRPEHDLRDSRIAVLRLRGWAYHLRGDNRRATRSIRDAIAMIHELKPAPGADEQKFIADVRRRLENFQTILNEYSQEAAPSAKDPR